MWNEGRSGECGNAWMWGCVRLAGERRKQGEESVDETSCERDGYIHGTMTMCC